jgi:hypothetical protein
MIEETLKQIYASEINIKLISDWDGGYIASTGSDYTNTWSEPVFGQTLEDTLNALSEQIKNDYPDSQYTYWLTNGTVEGYEPIQKGAKK